MADFCFKCGRVGICGVQCIEDKSGWDDPKSDPIGDIKRAIERELARPSALPVVWLHHPQCDLITGNGECNCQPLIAR